MAKTNRTISADDFASDIPVDVNQSDTDYSTEQESDFSVEDVTDEGMDTPTIQEVEVPIEKQKVKKVNRTGSETEIREVDPTKNAKLQKRLKQKPTVVAVGGFRLPKKLLYIAIPVVVIAIMVIVKLVQTKTGTGGSNSDNYFGIVDKILQTEIGTFEYSFDVRTKEMEPIEEKQADSNYEEVAETEGGDVTEELASTPQVEMKNKFTESWGTADDVQVFSWQYPNYKVTFKGICTDASPENYTAQIEVDLATAGHNDKITEIIAKDGKYYVDFNSLGVWLRSSKDAYLMSLGKDIPEGAKYVIIKPEDFKIPSRYAEDYEFNDSAVVGLQNNIRILTALVKYLEDNLQGCIGKECYSTSVSEGGGSTQNITIGTSTGAKIAESVKGLALNSASSYDNYIQLLYDNGLLTEEQAQQKMKEKDNFLYAITPLQVYFNTNSIDATNVQAVGSAMEYVSGAGGEQTAEAKMRVTFKSDTKDYDIQIDLMRKIGEGNVEVDTGNVIDIAQLVTDSETIGNQDPTKVGITYLLDKFDKLIDYLNPTCIQLSKQLEPSPERIAETIKQSLVDVVNSVPETGVYLTPLTVDKYIEIYKEFIDKKDELADGSSDLYNTLILEDFLNKVNDITGGVIVEVPVEAEVEQVRYPELVYEDSDMKIIARYNQEESNKNVYVVSATVMNKTSNQMTLNLTNFSLKTLLSSTYSSNNLTTLRDYDNTWDESLTPQAMVLEPSSYADIDLYFVVAGDNGYMDMWYTPIDKAPIKLGVIVQE